MEKFIGINLIIISYLYYKNFKNNKNNNNNNSNNNNNNYDICNKYRNIKSLKTRHHY